jgi:hypothetical protein
LPRGRRCVTCCRGTRTCRGSPSVSFSQLFIAAHKEINRSEQMKTVPPMLDATAEPVAEEKVEW